MDMDVELVSNWSNVLSQGESRCGSRQEAHDLIVFFRQDAIELSNACRKDAAEFEKHVGKSGRPKLTWYVDFKTLLFEMARLGGVDPRPGKDRITEERKPQ
jgi:hypothetical protein